jgi:hypothetical protein
MVTVETPDGTQFTYRLARSRGSRGGWRIVHRLGSYELLTMLESGWRVVYADTDTDRRRLRSLFRAHLQKAHAPDPSSMGTSVPSPM